MELSDIQRELLDTEPLRKKIILIFSILLIIACIYFSFECGEFVRSVSLYQYSSPMKLLSDIVENAILPFIFLGITVKGLLLIK
jgi:hypothetical protein